MKQRFQDAPAKTGLPDATPAAWPAMAERASCRRFCSDDVSPDLVRMLCALALSSPSKSDLQQRDLIIVSDDSIRHELLHGIPGGDWIEGAPVFIVVCGNNRRHRQVFERRDQAFVNDHLDAFFNASVDAGVVLGAMVAAAEAAGLGCCPISVIRNEAQRVSDLLGLPDHVFPVAGLALGWPEKSGEISARLPLSVTVHENRFDESELTQKVIDYDAWRARSQPYAHQRHIDRFGQVVDYGWSEDKMRQYSVPERPDFGRFVRARGFKLD